MRRLASAAGLGVRMRRCLGIRIGRLMQYPPRPLSLTTLARPGSDAGLPSLTLVTPSFNQAQFIARTIDSVLAQAYPALQYVVQDALSGDGTRALLGAYADRGLVVRCEADAGQADALNRGFAGSSGQIMGYLNSDDLLLPGTLHMVGRYFRDHPDVDLVYGNRLIVDESDREVGRWILPGHDGRILRFIDYVPQETLFWRRQLWDRAGARFDAQLQFAMDWELLLRFQDAGARMRHLPELFGVFRVHGGQKSQALYRTRGAREMVALRARHRAPAALPRVLLHWRYLQAHRAADAEFAASLRNP
jgi:glycosyltransferase involved in cell wall biosynthesis